MFSKPKDGQTKKEYTEARVPQLIREGKTPDQAIAECNAMWEAARDKYGDNEPSIEVCTEKSLEFSAEIGDGIFINMSQEDVVLPKRTFAEVLTMLGCEPGKRYEIEISVEEV